MKSKSLNFIVSLIILLFCVSVLTHARQNEEKIIIDRLKTAQRIDNFGASGCWFAEGIGSNWPAAKKKKIAALLFSKKLDPNGNPEGIGLSAWRFNIGAATAEQGDSSGIKDYRKRTDSFLDADGSYNWDKQPGQRFFLQQAHNYGVETLVAFSNSPPVYFTKNGLGYKTVKDYKTNLRDDKQYEYADYLATVLKHFKKAGLGFNYISPVNEPQWDWSRKYMEADQEGSPWTNEEIFGVTKALNKALEKNKLKTHIIIPEAGMLNYLYGGSGLAARQIQHFFDPKSRLYLGDQSQVANIAAGHSYFTESDNKTLVDTRRKLADSTARYGITFWQSEYSMLADGFREGSKGDRSQMDCALFLTKVIHSDLTIANATAWQFWNSFEPGSAEINTRYYMIALKGDADFKDGSFTVTKNLWALGHYSRFVRPGMTRLPVTTKNSDLLVSCYEDDRGKLVLVGVNYGREIASITPEVLNKNRPYKSMLTYLTTADKLTNMSLQAPAVPFSEVVIPARSIVTIVID